MLFFQLIVIAKKRTWTRTLLQPRSKRYFFVQLVSELCLSTSPYIDACMFLQSLACHQPLTCEVCQIHRRLPPGGILVFMTGQVSYTYSFLQQCNVFQSEIYDLCERLKGKFGSDFVATGDGVSEAAAAASRMH